MQIADKPKLEDRSTTEEARSRSRGLFLLPPAIAFLILFLTCYLGRDYGQHYDEPRLTSAAELSLQDGIFLPQGFYNYPSMSYWISVFASIPNKHDLSRLPKAYVEGAAPRAPIQMERDQAVQDFRLRARTLFAFVSSLAVFWVYFAVLRWRKQVWIASIAAFAYGSAWAIGYHARWMAPDAILAQFAAFALWCCVEIRVSSQPRAWSRTGAIAVGVCASTKYPGALMLLPLLGAVVQRFGPDKSRTELLRQVALLVVMAGAAYLIITPGTILEPFSFIDDVKFEAVHYHTGHFGHTVRPGFPHMWAMAGFLAFSLFSHLPVVSCFIFAIGLIGGVLLLFKDRSWGWIYLAFPLIYFLYLSTQHVFFVRNLLVLAPFVACWASYAVDIAGSNVDKWARFAIPVTLFPIFATNSIWLYQSAESIIHRSKGASLQEFEDYVNSHPERKFWLSPEILKQVSFRPKNLEADARQAEFVALLPREPFLARVDWPALDWNLTVKTFGPQETDFNFYPSWIYEDRIVLMSKEMAMKRLPPAFLAGSSDRSKYLPITLSVPPPNF